tara:strand:+ start:1828 stop:2202 length:375 start_codon:yes stop_codon:yes gene_type:complete
MRLSIILFLIGLGGYISAHQFTPTYPELSLSYVKGIYKADMLLFNNRKEISYYSIGVFDKDWKPVKFATENRIVKMKHLERKTITVYIRKEDKNKALYICSKSKTLVDYAQTSIVTSRICSKIK